MVKFLMKWQSDSDLHNTNYVIVWFCADIFTAIALGTFISCHAFVADKLTV